MESSLELRKSSSHKHNPKVGKERVFLPQSKRSPFPKVPENLKTKNPIQPHSDLHCASRKETDFVRGKSSLHWQGKGKSFKGSPTGDDELVRHMKNLPGYLLGAERGENRQEKKALNVGVLDWAQLESWKHKQIYGPIKGKNDTPCSRGHASSKQSTGLSTFSAAVQSETSAKSHSSHQSGLIASHKAENSHRVTSDHHRYVINSQDHDSGSKSAMKERQKVQRNTSSGRSNSNIIHERERSKRSDRKIRSEMVNCSSHERYSGVIPSPKGSAPVFDGKANHRTEKLIETDVRNKDEHERVILGVGKMPSNLSNGISQSLNDYTDVENKETRKPGKHCSDIDLPYRYFSYEQDVNLLLKQKPKNLEEDFQSLHSRTSFDENVLDMNSSSYSEIFSPDGIFSSECGSEIPYSCPLPSLADTDAMMGTMQDCLASHSTAEHSSSPNLRSSLSKRSEHGKSGIKVSHFEFDDTLQTMDEETTEPGARKGRHPSPNRRFSFSLGRMGRSFSFKESSAVPQLSSTYITPKSGPVVSETSRPENLDAKKVNGHNRTRSSPLRRLIEPILKHKSSNSQHSCEGNFHSLNFWPTGLGSAQKKHAPSTMQALLQITIKNGLPLFKLLVDNNRNILAATIKDLTSSGKNDSSQNYTFYLVNEIKRKSGVWIRPGNREKSYGYAYNVIGQMKVKSDFKTCELNTDGKYMFRESVLFGVEMRPADRESAITVKNRELAAVVFKIPIENLNHNGQQDDKVLVKDYMKSVSEDDTIVILPGAVHGSPSSGEPSPLINRWRSGGLCDCGGWDVGCKLRVLSIPNKLITSQPCPIPDRFELVIQGEGQQKKPFFSLAPLKGGFFEVHFDSSISMLQAFFICVSVLNGQKPADLSEASKFASEEKNIKYPNSNVTNAVREKAPTSVRYAPIPPLSPVGRV